ncbi:hypothetical protein [Micromonospora sp. NPDC093277]|uniref:hypothetical protein n=1 Tax=Micromonospora sp. NPDC093277 TaxID=3364291 RepID=UPI00380D3A91
MLFAFGGFVYGPFLAYSLALFQNTADPDDHLPAEFAERIFGPRKRSQGFHQTVSETTEGQPADTLVAVRPYGPGRALFGGVE